MKGKSLKIGWALLGLWIASIVVIANSYRSTQATIDQVYELGSGIQELRDSLSFDSPYRVHMADSQSLNLQLIYALRLQLDAHYRQSWLLPDINRLLFTTDRFIEQSQIYLDSNLDLLGLVEQMGTMRERYAGQETEGLYLRLSANVLAAVFGDKTSSPQVYRDLDNIYTQSNQLPAKERQDVQQVLAQVSSVLGGYAQGRYIVEKLQNHDVLQQIDTIRGEFSRLLTQHIALAILITLVIFGGYMSLLRLVYRVAPIESMPINEPDVGQEVGESSKSEPPSTEQTESELNQYQASLPPTSPSSETPSTSGPQINVDKMLESLNHDTESVAMLLEVFIEDHSGDAQRIRQIIERSPEEAKRIAHSLKGVGGNLGATSLRETASKVEVAIKKTDSVAPELLAELNTRLEQAIEEAQAYLIQNNAIKS